MSGIADITLRQGSGYYNTWTINDTQGNPVDLSNYSGFAGIKYNYGASGFMGVFNFNIINATSGQISLSIDSTGVAALPMGQFLYELNVAESGNANSTGVLYGRLNINPQVF